ncbi:heme oxygenase (biliverdin-producing) [Tychonema sp. LEGE 07203]|uniref:biliverdin-producing heme oxygenase n=1 Tax=Tychonema sp. LEGE 07203 TaxID=1828671 RepID=UPI00187EF90D|nr:biliverdin-producing heme oxygenase [Tychonema sp. LEGE 07203]MBE9093518.1 biliverdin-producing heme oxygenase [Tychonema sp. LEGE 07203]
MTTDLASKLRSGTQQAHSNAEHTKFMTRFLKGDVDENILGKLLGNLYQIYSQLEAELESHQEHPIVSHLYFSELNRKTNLEKDLTFLYGDSWQEKVFPTPNAQIYISRIREVSATQPELLIAHAYTRYMGDLSGGQSLKKIAKAALDLKEDQSINFYEFSQIPDVTQFKGKYRDALNHLMIDETLMNQIVQEANLAFNLNIKMMGDLA